MNDCPVCNGFYNLELACPCGSALEDMGRLADFIGPYSPYQDLVTASDCVHLYYCPACGKDRRVPVSPDSS